MAKYLLITDYGKPDSQYINSDARLKKELKKLKKMSESGEYAYVDFTVYYLPKGKNGAEIDVTEDMLKKFKLVD